MIKTTLRPPSMKRINIIAWDNGFGLTRHIRLLTEALQSSGYDVTLSSIRRGKLRKWFRPLKMRWLGLWFRLSGGDTQGRFDANIMIEHIRPDYLQFARINLFAPHPEWCLPMDVAMLETVDAVLCMTHHAAPIFQAQGSKTAFIGLTSEDRLDSNVMRERKFFHLAGRSQNKGTEQLLEIWRKHPEWPTLTVVQNPFTAKLGAATANIVHRIDYVDDLELRHLQNSHLFHVCTSETEGYGHYLVEAMSVGAIALTTDAPPMNEMITSDRGIRIPFDRTGKQHLATTYFFSEQGLIEAVNRTFAMDDAQIANMGLAARTWFNENHKNFPARLHVALKQML